jgi:hypothetical protein
MQIKIKTIFLKENFVVVVFMEGKTIHSIP